MLLVHGFSQNRHAWTSGEFVKNLLFFGLDIHILELRGHGKSSIALSARARPSASAASCPPTSTGSWDIDSYFLYDLPAAVAGVRRITRRERIFYCGHSMGGILGYGYAGIHDDFEGSSPSARRREMGSGSLPLKRARAGRAAARAWRSTRPSAALNVERSAGARACRRWPSRVRRKLHRADRPRKLEVPLRADRHLAQAGRRARWATRSRALRWWGPIASQVNWLARWDRLSMDDVRWLLARGRARRSRARWSSSSSGGFATTRSVCYRTGYDFKRGFSKIKVPMAIIFGDMDPLASVESTRSVYRSAQAASTCSGGR